ncbi:adenosylcobinamide-phosphate synthase CbiB [Solibacillus sp. FSL W7-1324]|uniref:adenosylcobinamide-phosphate synthase CbiB n=1 Tax=Solibacillus sp. FSL W7-1324 TaxID=2921701 RepID=UPI0030F7DA6F
MYFIICVIAVLIDCIVGDPKKWTHPVIYIGNVISFFERKWNNGSNCRRRFKGFLTVFLTVSITTGSVFFIVFLAMKVHILLWLAVEIFLISLALAQKSLKEAAMLVYDSLKANDLPEARKYLSWIVGRDTNHLDEAEIVRGVIETVSENTSDGVTAPLMYALFFGATGAWCYKAINTLDSMIGYKNERYADFGYGAAKLDDVANYVPSRISGWFLIIFTKCHTAQPFKHRYKNWLKDAKKHPSPNSGYLEAATAVQLGIRLGGFNRYGGVESFRAYMGEPDNTMQKIHIKKAIRHMYVCTWCVVITGGILYAIARTWG